jgi:hypothetical protein
MRLRTASTAFVCLALFAAATALASSLTGSGRSITQDRAVTGYSGIALSLPAQVEVVQGAAEGVRITADDNVMPEIESVVEGNVLQLRYRRRFDSVVNAHIRITVNAKALQSLAVAGAGGIRAPALDARRLAVSVAGSGDVKVGGRAEALEANLTGSGNLDAGKLDTQRTRVSIAGSGAAVVWARQALTVNVAGSGDIRYYGDPAIARSIVGLGSVRRLGAAPA